MFRRLALALPGAEEGSHQGHPDFRVNGRVFASLDAKETVGMAVVTPVVPVPISFLAVTSSNQPFTKSVGEGVSAACACRRWIRSIWRCVMRHSTTRCFWLMWL